MLNITLTSIVVVLTPIAIKAETVTAEVIPIYPIIISMGLFISSVILFLVPNTGCVTRIVKSILYISFILISGSIAYSLLSSGVLYGPAYPGNGGFHLPVYSIAAATVFPSLLALLKLSIPLLTTAEQVATYTTIVVNIMTIIQDLVGLARAIDGDHSKPPHE